MKTPYIPSLSLHPTRAFSMVPPNCAPIVQAHLVSPGLFNQGSFDLFSRNLIRETFACNDLLQRLPPNSRSPCTPNLFSLFESPPCVCPSSPRTPDFPGWGCKTYGIANLSSSRPPHLSLFSLCIPAFPRNMLLYNAQFPLSSFCSPS